MKPIQNAPLSSLEFLWAVHRPLFLDLTPRRVEAALEALSPWSDLARALPEEAPADLVGVLQGLGSLRRRLEFDGKALSEEDETLAREQLRLFAQWADSHTA